MASQVHQYRTVRRWKESLLSLPKKWLSGTQLLGGNTSTASSEIDYPKLPVPPLEQTLQKYLKHLKPLLNDTDHERVSQIVENFGSETGLGRKLQLYLLDRREKTDNWALDYWLNDMYLNIRLPLPINSNPGAVYPSRKFTTVLDVARLTSRIIDFTLDHKQILDQRTLPVEKAASREPGQPLCMSQYYRILSSCRIPGKVQDSQYITPVSQHHTEHVIIMCRSQIYCVPVVAPDRGRLSEDEICSQIMHILEDAPTVSNPPPIGILTSWKRNLWGEVRENLEKDETNKRNFEMIAKSLLIICLDEGLPTSFNLRSSKAGKSIITAGGRDETNLLHQMIHGGGCNHNSSNRWFDKTTQIIISGDGACGLCFEHSQADGVAIQQFLEQMWKKVDALPQNYNVPATNSHLPPPERLEWTLEADDHKKIEEAASHFDNLTKDLDLQVFRYTTYGKSFMKSCKVSPDAYIQLALQLTYYRLNGKLTATYESASTRRFKHGRIDCIRSASPEALAWAAAMGQPKEDDEIGNRRVTFHLVSDEKKLQLWKEAVKQQTSEMVDNILGQGIDIHLLGLREAARETSPTAAHPLPEIFTHSSYRLANKFLLTTSQVTTSMESFMGYGPVEPDGYGASYNIQNDYVLFCISAFWSSETTSTTKFTQVLEESLNNMQALLSRQS